MLKTCHLASYKSLPRYLAGLSGGCLLAPLLLYISLAGAGDVTAMRQVSDLRQEANLIKADRLVLVLEFASEDCGYCRKLEKQFLLPMQRNRYYDDKILIRSISMSDFDDVIDFSGQSMTTSEFATRYDVDLTPTLLFLNAEGEEISERLVGIWSEDFYGGFIDSRIEEASSRL